MAAPLQSTAPSGAPDPVVPPSSRSPSPQRYCLKWNNYQSNVTSTFKELLEVEDFVDITLMAEGGTLRAHKVVLSACSPYFRDILKGIAAWQHPVIVLKDVPFSHLQGIVEFIYHGEVSVDQTSLDFFLNTAQLLRVKGLADDAFTNNNSQDFCKQPARPSTHMHHPRKSLRPTRALIKRDIVPSESMREIGPNPSKRTATDDDSILVIDELKQDCSQDTDKDKNGSDGSEEEEIDDVEEDDEGESGDEEEEEISPLIAASSQHKSNNSMSQDWDNPDDKKQRNLLMSMSGGGLSIVPKFFEQSFGLTQLQNFDENSSPAIPSTSEGEPGGSGGAGQKKTCPYCFQQLSWHALSRHIRDMHRAKTGYVTCKFCFKMFRNKNSLGCHMWRFHKDAKDQRVDEPSVKNDESGAVSM